MNIDAETKLYCLIGNPIEKSLSPSIHNYSFKKNNINAKYLAFKVENDSLGEYVNGVRAMGIQGFNITIPFKIEIIKYLDELDEEAKILGAVNTVRNENGKLKGFNTDGRGFTEILKTKKAELKDSEILIIGAGGAARAIIISLALENPKKITIINRTKEKAEAILSDINSKIKNIKTKIEINDSKAIKNCDIVINCTSIGMYPNDNKMPIDITELSENAIVADIVYKPLKTKFLQAAEERGNTTIDGLGMLINQGLLGEEIWTGIKFNKELLIDDIRKEILLKI